MSKAFPHPYPLIYPPNENLIPPKTVLYLDPDNSSGSKIIDGSGMMNHCQIYNGAVKKSKNYGNSFYFDGVDDYISSTIKLKEKGTISMWIDPYNPIGGANEIFVGSKESGIVNAFTIYNNSGTSRLQAGWVLNGSDKRASISNAFPQGFFLLTVKWDVETGITKVYYNTTLCGQSTGLSSVYSMLNPIYFMKYNTDGGTTPTKGSLGEAWVVNDCLSLQQIKALIEETAWKYGVKI